MPFYLDQENVGSDFNTLQSLAPTGGEAFGAQFHEAFFGNPTVLGMEAYDVARANTRGPRLTAFEAAARARESGDSTFAPGDAEYTREALDIALDRKRQQRQRQDVIAGTPWSWTGTPVRAAGMLGATLLDPLNIGAAFVPVVREARYSALLAGAGGAAGRAGIRAAVGAAEGLVGSVALEPFILGAHAYLDDDYTMKDSLLNLAFGTFLGGGLHVVGGRVADALAPGRWDAVRTLDEASAQADLPAPRTDTGTPAPGSAAETVSRAGPEVRAQALTVAVAHMAEGKVVEVAPLFNDPAAVALAREAEARRAEAEGYDPDATLKPLEEPLARLVPEVGWAVRGGQLLRRETEATIKGHPGGGDVIGRTKWGAKSEFWPDRPGPNKLSEKQALRALEKAEAGEKLGVAEQKFIDYARAYLQKFRSADVADAMRAEIARAEAVAERRAIRAESGMLDEEWATARLDEANAQAADYEAEIRAAAARQASGESSASADYAAALAAEERLAKAPKGDAEVAATALADAAIMRAKTARAGLEAAGASEKTLAEFDKAMAEADGMVAHGETLGRAVEAAAECGISRA